jgi:hypothetical protein
MLMSDLREPACTYALVLLLSRVPFVERFIDTAPWRLRNEAFGVFDEACHLDFPLSLWGIGKVVSIQYVPALNMSMRASATCRMRLAYHIFDVVTNVDMIYRVNIRFGCRRK